MSSLHDGRDGNQRSNLKGGSIGVFEQIAAVSNRQSVLSLIKKAQENTILK